MLFVAKDRICLDNLLVEQGWMAGLVMHFSSYNDFYLAPRFFLKLRSFSLQS